MTPREWHDLTVALDEEIPLDWEWISDDAIGISKNNVWFRIDVHQGKWNVECEDRVKRGGYYDPPEYEFSHSFQSSDAEDVVSHIRSII